MGRQNGHNIANGVISTLVLICGVTFSALVATLLQQLVEGAIKDVSDLGLYSTSEMDGSIAYASMPLWALGFSYIIPGLIGCIAFCVKQKGAYITQMVFCIISLLIMGIFFVVAFIAIGALTSANPDLNTCHDDAKGKCQCGITDSLYDSSDSSADLPYSCGDLRSMYGKGVGILLMIVFGWILTLTITIISGILACRQEYSPGMVIQTQAQVPSTTIVHMRSVNNMPVAPPQVAYMPPAYDQTATGYMQPQQQTHDHAKLVHNMEY